MREGEGRRGEGEKREGEGGGGVIIPLFDHLFRDREPLRVFLSVWVRFQKHRTRTAV